MREGSPSGQAVSFAWLPDPQLLAQQQVWRAHVASRVGSACRGLAAAPAAGGRSQLLCVIALLAWPAPVHAACLCFVPRRRPVSY